GPGAAETDAMANMAKRKIS
ncbi:hypothetical protein NPIL_241301, partial [Nephila pilipes]